ncbi:hypothetical protein [Marinobacter sp. V034]|uniref:hypothetical protein n=1 Tax=Marinobacter TaxID=2742 RepID=UPI0040447FD0
MSTQLLIELSLIGSVFLICGIGWLLSRKSRRTAGHTVENVLTGMLGAFLLMAGLVKFFDPFAQMFASQVALSGLPFPTLSKWAGQFGEMFAGGLFLFVLFAGGNLKNTITDRLFFSATALTAIIMIVAVYVHLEPNVPASVLPLQTKPPILTLIVMAFVGFNAWLHITNSTQQRGAETRVIS